MTTIPSPIGGTIATPTLGTGAKYFLSFSIPSGKTISVEVQGASYGISSLAAVTGSGANSSAKPSFTDLTITHADGAASFAELQALSKGQTFTNVTLEAFALGANGQYGSTPVEMLSLGNGLVSNFYTDGSVDTVSFAFTKLATAVGLQSFSWDLATNRAPGGISPQSAPTYAQIQANLQGSVSGTHAQTYLELNAPGLNSWIPVQGFSFGLSEHPTGSNGSAAFAAGKLIATDITLSLTPTSIDAALQTALATGKTTALGYLVTTAQTIASGQPVVTHAYQFGNISVTGFSAARGAASTDTLSLHYTSVDVQTFQQNAAGTVSLVGEVGYDLLTGKAMHLGHNLII